MPHFGGRRRKRRTHVQESTDDDQNVPRSIIARRGVVAEPVIQLISNLRQVMEPHTARRLQERTKTRLRDLLHVCGPLGVTHVLTLSQNACGTNLRIVRTPRGPTLSLRVQNYSLCADIERIQKRPVAIENHLKSAPLVVLNNLAKQPIVAAMFQNMFPAINVRKVRLASCRRIVLFSYDDQDECIHFRHFLVNASPTGLSRSVRMVVKARVPNLHKYKDISDVVINELGAGSDSEAEDLPESKVTLPQDFAGRGNRRSHQSSIRLTEIGPRMQLQLVKIQEGIADGPVIFNRFVSKTSQEIASLHSSHEEQQATKAKRRQVQEDRVKVKRQRMEEKRLRKRARTATRKAAESISSGKRDEQRTAEMSEDDDDEWYRIEVGAEPDHAISSSGSDKKKLKNKRKR